MGGRKSSCPCCINFSFEACVWSYVINVKARQPQLNIMRAKEGDIGKQGKRRVCFKALLDLSAQKSPAEAR
jgi:hypothetical protein